MRFHRLSPAVATGVAGLVAGILYEKLPLKQHLLVNSAGAVDQDVEAIVSNELGKRLVGFSSVAKFGIPSYDTIRTKGNFMLAYDRNKKVPHWVMEHLTPDITKGEAKRFSYKFSEDKTLHPYFRSSPEDYNDGRYDKGHLAASGNYKNSQECLRDTFITSNAAPQIPHFNQKTWHYLEEHARKLAGKYENVYVCSGPLYLPRSVPPDAEQLLKLSQDSEHSFKRTQQEKNSCPQAERKYVIYEVIGDNNVAVPTHFFKAIVCEDKDKELDMETYMLPNKALDPKEPLQNYLVPRESIERAAGFLLFQNLKDDAFRSINSLKNLVAPRQRIRGQ